MKLRGAETRGRTRIDFWSIVDVGAVAVMVLVAAAWLLIGDGRDDVRSAAPMAEGGAAERPVSVFPAAADPQAAKL